MKVEAADADGIGASEAPVALALFDAEADPVTDDVNIVEIVRTAVTVLVAAAVTLLVFRAVTVDEASAEVEVDAVDVRVEITEKVEVTLLVAGADGVKTDVGLVLPVALNVETADAVARWEEPNVPVGSPLAVAVADSVSVAVELGVSVTAVVTSEDREGDEEIELHPVIVINALTDRLKCVEKDAVCD